MEGKPSEVDKVVSAALEAAKLRRAKAEQLAGLASPASDRVGLKRKTSKNGGTPATPATTVPSSEKVTPDPKHSRTDAVEPKELFAAPKEDAEQPEGQKLHRGMSSMSTIPATEEEVQAAKLVVPPLPQLGNASGLGLPADVQRALSALASNPVFMKNPEGLGEFVKALAQPDVQKIPTPSNSRPSCAHSGDGGDGEGLAARKAFWSKYKRPIEGNGQIERSESTQSILSKPTLILGETIPDDTLETPEVVSVVVPETAAPTAQEREPVPPSQDVVTETVPPTPREKEPVPPATQEVVVPETVPPPPQDVVVIEKVPPTPQDVVATEKVPPTPQDVAPVVTVPKPPTDVVPEVVGCSVRARLQKMDALELTRKVEAAKSHCSFPGFLILAAKTAEEFGATDMVEDLACFQYHLDFSDAQPPASESQQTPALTPEEVTPQPEEPPVDMEVDSKVPDLQGSNGGHQGSDASSKVTAVETEAKVPGPTPVLTPPDAAMNTDPSKAPTVPPPNQSVATVLTRMQTVDLDNGMRPPQSLSGTESQVSCQTVVLLTLNGVIQPVTLPMTPEQCVAAGLTLANSVKGNETVNTALGSAVTPCESDASKHKTAKPPVPEFEERVEEDPCPDTSSKQMLKNLYMRFSRSSTRQDLPPEIAAKFTALKDKEKKLGRLAPAVRKERQQLFEEFIQAGENWSESSIVLNSKSSHLERQRGVYKLFSREDLMVKYHQNKGIVDEIVKSKEELGDYEVNPDCVSLRLYRCWDSKALISEDDTSRAINVRSEGAITASQAMPLMQTPGLVDPSFRTCAGGSGGTTNTPPEKDPSKLPKDPKDPKEPKVPKVKTANQEAKAAMSLATGLIMEGQGWSQKLLDVGVPEQLRIAVCSDVEKNVEVLKTTRTSVEACIARGANDDQLRTCTQALAKTIADYKQAAKSAQSLHSQNKPKPKGKSKAKAKAKALALPAPEAPNA